MLDSEIGADFLNLNQVMDTQSQVITTQVQAMPDQANLEVAPRMNRNASTLGSRLRDFTSMNPAIVFGSKVNEYTQDFLDKVYTILYSMVVCSNEKAELAAYLLKDVAQT